MLLRPDRFQNYIYAWAVQRVENREEFDRDLTAPIRGITKVVGPTPEQIAQEGSDFLSFMGAVQGTG